MSSLHYSSTRSSQENISFSEAVVRGIAPDGGLYVPSSFPQLDITDEALKSMTYQTLAKRILGLYLTDFTDAEITECVDSAYDHKFADPHIAPLKSFGAAHFIELYHGRTLAFKDMALSILPYFLKMASKKCDLKEEIVILTATSGDTGKAALEGFADVEGIKIFVFYPTDGVSEVQKRQMTTQEGDNVTVFGITGNFDDAQNGVKAMFLNEELKADLLKKGYVFSSANSINIGRLLPQIVYYINAYFTLVREGTLQTGDPINVAVPTGNFGNILAAYYAKQMGLPIKQLICASNVNHVLTDFISTGTYDIRRPFHVTNSPSMDILISSNLERFLYAISEGDATTIDHLMTTLKKDGLYTINDAMKDKLTHFTGGYATDAETIATIKALYDRYDYVADTHTAVAYKVYSDYASATGDTTHTLIASTASPFKFTQSVVEGLGIDTKGIDDFELIQILAKATTLDIPKPIVDLENKPILHPKTIDKSALMHEVVMLLK